MRLLLFGRPFHTEAPVVPSELRPQTQHRHPATPPHADTLGRYAYTAAPSVTRLRAAIAIPYHRSWLLLSPTWKVMLQKHGQDHANNTAYHRPPPFFVRSQSPACPTVRRPI